MSLECPQEFGRLVWFANAFLWVALAAAVLVTLLSLAERWMTARKAYRGGLGERAALGDAGWVDSLKGLVTALAQAPPWFAIFLAGVVLLFMAARFTPAACDTPPVAHHPQSAPAA